MTDDQNQSENGGLTKAEEARPQTQDQPNQQQPVVHANVQVDGVKPATSGMAIASLVLGILAILFSFIPVVNGFSFVLVILGIIFGIVGIVGTGVGKKGGRGLAIAGLVISVIACIVTIAINALFVAAVDSVTNEPTETVVAEVVEESSEASSAADNTAASSATDQSSAAGTSSDTYEQATSSQYAVTIDSCKQTKDYKGKAVVVITYTWTNNSDRSQAFYTAITDKAFQDGVELESAYLTNGESTKNATKEIKPGKSLKVKQAFRLDSKTEPVTVECSEWVSFTDALLAKKTFNLK